MFRKRMIRFMVLVMMAVITLVPGMGAAGQGEKGMDLLILMDNGFSLTKTDNPTDPDGYRFDAAATLLSMMDRENSRANYVLFNQKLLQYSKNKLTEIPSKSGIGLYDVSLSLGKARRMQYLTELTDPGMLHKFDASSGTDIGLALDEAVDALLRNDNGNKKTIVLFTDGGIYFAKDPDLSTRQKQRQLDESYEKAIAAKARAEENGVTIHTVLLNDTSAIELMQSELRTADGLFFMVNDAAELPNVFTQIYAQEIEGAVQAANGKAIPGTKIAIRVPNGHVDGLNILVPLTHAEANAFTLISPNGRVMTDADSDYYCAASENSIIYKVETPEKGEWQLLYSGEETNQEITVRYLPEYDLTGKIDASAGQLSKNEAVTIEAYFEKNGIRVADKDLYTVPAIMTLYRNDEAVEQVILNASERGYFYTFDSMSQYGAGNYTASVHYEGMGLLRDVYGAAFTLMNKAPIRLAGVTTDMSRTFIINTPGVESSFAIQSHSWELGQFVTDPDGDSIVYKIASVPEGLTARIDGTNLVVSTVQNTTANGDVVIAVSDKDGMEGPELRFHVETSSAEANLGTVVYGPMQVLTKREDSAVIRMQLTERGTILSQSEYYDIPAMLTLKKGEQTLYSKQMEYNGEAYVYTIADLKQYGAGVFTAEIRMESGSFVMDCEPIEIRMVNALPKAAAETSLDCVFNINDPEKAETYEVQTREYALDSLVTDSDGDKLTWSIRSNEADAKAVVSGSTLTISTKKNTTTTGDVVVSVADSDGAAGPDLTFHVSVGSVEETVGIAVSGPTKPIRKNDPVTITAQFMQNGMTVSKTSGMNTIPMTLSVMKGEETVLKAAEMICSDGLYTCVTEELYQYGAGEYTAIVQAENGPFRMQSEAYAFTLQNSAPVLAAGADAVTSCKFDINIPGEPSSYEVQSRAYDLNTYVSDENGDKLTWSIRSNEADAKAVVSGSTLTISTKKNTMTTGDVVVSAVDSDGAAGPELTFRISAVSIEEVYDRYTAVVKPIEGYKNSSAAICACVYDENGNKVSDDTYLPDEVEAEIKEGENVNRTILTRNENGDYIGSFQTGKDEATYCVSVCVTVGEKSIQSDEVSFATKNRGPVLQGDLPTDYDGTLYIGVGKPLTIELGRYFADPDGDVLTYTVNGNDAAQYTTITMEDGVLTVTPLQADGCMPVECRFSVAAHDHEGGMVRSADVTVKLWPILIQIGIAAAAVIVLSLLIHMIRWKNAHFGEMAFQVSYGYKGLELPDQLSEPLPKGSHKPVSLGTYYTGLAKNACQEQISDDAMQKLIVKPMTGGRIRICVPGGLNVHVCAEAEVPYDQNDQRYRSSKEIVKAKTLRNGESVTICRNDRRVTFCPVKIRACETTKEKR